ncbi:MAG: ribonuclease III [Porticoccaceae bacterium]
MNRIQQLEKRAQLMRRLGYQFEDTALLELALSHRSVGEPNNERLEFLGDAVLGTTISKLLFNQFPQASEGDLSRMRSAIVRAESLATIARELDLGEHLHLGPGELKSGGFSRDSILGDSVEALIGAIYIDSDGSACESVISNWFAQALAAADYRAPAKDPKTALQEWLQQRGKPLPEYTLLEECGEPHQRTFVVSCKIALRNKPAQAQARSRRKAEQAAAAELLAYLEAQ